MNELEELDLTSFVTSNATDMSIMFYDTSKLKKLDISKLDTRNVTNMSAMFAGARSLTQLDLRHFNTSKVTTMKQIFADMSNVTEINISGIDVTKVTDASGFVVRNDNLKKLIASNLSFKSLHNYSYFMYDLKGFDGGEIDFINTYFKPTGTELEDTQYAFSSIGNYTVHANLPETKAFLQSLGRDEMNLVD